MENKEYFKLAIIKWAKKNMINYEWRNNVEPYKILISEILLHRTDSVKVEKIYPLFIKNFPTVYDLYDAELDEIAYFFKGMGLFYKAKRLKIMSEQIIKKHGGIVPNKPNDLKNLIGVGNYICNSVLCFGYKKRVPLIDTNFIRVYQRVFTIISSKSRPQNDKLILDFAEKMLPKKNYVVYNYAVLDFASSVCKAKNPKCINCPVTNVCHFIKLE